MTDHPGTRRPNLLLITTDQQRFDTLPPDAPGFLRTPHLDQLRGLPYQPMRHGLGQNELHPGDGHRAGGAHAHRLDRRPVRPVRAARRDPTVPFFLWASFTKPHPPLDPPEPYASMYRDAATR